MDQDAIWCGGIGFGPGDIVLDGDTAPPMERGPTFQPMSIVLWPNGGPSQQLLNSCLILPPTGALTIDGSISMILINTDVNVCVSL